MTALTTPNAIEAFRMATLIRGILLEEKGLKLSRGQSCKKIARDMLGLNRRATTAQIVELLTLRKEELLAE